MINNSSLLIEPLIHPSTWSPALFVYEKLVLNDLHVLVNYALNLPCPLKLDRHLVYLEAGEFIFPLSDIQYERWLLSLSCGFTESSTLHVRTNAHFISSHLHLSYCSIFHSITFRNCAILHENKRQNKQKHRDWDEKEKKVNMRESETERKGGVETDGHFPRSFIKLRPVHSPPLSQTPM